MAVRLLFPTFVFEVDLLNDDLHPQDGLTEEYLNSLKQEMDAMRDRDPAGRRVSNAYSGWQSNDGCESNPAFAQLIKKIQRVFQREVIPFHGLNPVKATMQMGNAWANINDFGAWNKPHLHNGCWYSGAFYIHAKGDEGNIDIIDKDCKVVADFPHSTRTPTSHSIQPTSGKLVLFPSGTMHMVEPNLSDKERYSIAFNIEMRYSGGIESRRPINEDTYNPDEFKFEIDSKGDPILK